MFSGVIASRVYNYIWWEQPNRSAAAKERLYEYMILYGISIIENAV